MVAFIKAVHRSGWLAVFLVFLPLAASSSPAGGQEQANFRVWLPVVNSVARATILHQGIATYYNATGAGTCMFDASPNDLMVTAMSANDFKSAKVCGEYLSVSGPKGTIQVRVVDLCPGCSPAHLDLSQTAFAQIADSPAGRVDITWRVVSPALTGPIAYHFKDGSNPWWTAVQIRNHRNPIARFEYQNSAGEWIPVPRTHTNYFVQTNPGMGPGPYTFRVTDSYGHVLVDHNVAFQENCSVNGLAQFPPGP